MWIAVENGGTPAVGFDCARVGVRDKSIRGPGGGGVYWNHLGDKRGSFAKSMSVKERI